MNDTEKLARMTEAVGMALAALDYPDGDEETGPNGDMVCKVCDRVVLCGSCSGSCPIDLLRNTYAKVKKS